MIPIPACVLVTSPVDGWIRSTIAGGSNVLAGDIVATVSRGGASVINLIAPRAGRVGGALGLASQPIASGDGVVWLDR